MTTPFTDLDLDTLSQEVERQLTALRREDLATPSRGGLPERQADDIERETGAAAPSFLKRFARAARKDLCEDGGVLHEQWKRHGDLNKKEVVKNFGAVLVMMGFAGSALQILAVALAVLALHLGIKTVCEEV